MILDNSPADSWIRITGVIVTYNNTLYQVVDKETNKKYIYWDADNPGTLKESNIRLSEGNSQFLVVVNDNGKHTEVPINSSIFNISFDGNSRKNTEEQIWGLYETDEKHNEKFVVIEKDIDGIHQTVLEVQEDASHMKENMSLIDQRAENVNILVKEVTKNFGGSQENIKLRESINNAVIKLNTDLGTFSSNMSNYFNDNEVTTEEKEKIDIELKLLDTDKANLYIELQKLIDKSSGVDTVLINTSKSALDSASTNLNSIINSVISDNIITPNDRILAINATAQYNLKINELKNTVDKIYITGMGGSISEEFAQINTTAKEIKLEVARVDGATKTNAAQIKLTKDDITMMVTRDSSNAIIGIKPDKIEFGFNDISNYVEIDRSGLTVNQGAIACDILTTPSGHEPIIRLFGSSRSGFAIDARRSDGASQASAIRLKYDSNNYFFVGNGSAAIYVDAYENYKFDLNEAKLGANKIGVGSDGYTRMDLTRGSFRLYTSRDEREDDNGIVIWKRGAISFMINGEEKQQFSRSGSKTAGSIEINGTTFGMSPVDSPKFLIEDVLFDIEVEETGTIIKLNNIFAQSILNFAVFSSNANCEVIEKGNNYFKVKGYTGKCDFRVIGKRKGYEHTYYKIMGGEEQHGDWQE
ncbi:TPA: tail fiber domain-containing protein [Clostridioides difficile]|nr:tail fiber domain-containing protein [Clostridioides difficile]EII6832928.1 tail fiber domain-containing protein [Clostridioides difficile]MBF9984188.1 tail fiber domain-containing protein [Clostridioides difficile]MBH7250126.1 tail fiber domain-containing protein [Clostridioides difficile]MBH7461017.1 tail fiber domain-containing protein [Clostridioides difficile]